MRRALLAGVAVLFATVATPAHAHPDYHYIGGCGFATLRDDSTASPTWRGEADVYVVATDAEFAPAAVPISVDCVIYVNGANPRTILSASGVGVAAAARTWSYEAEDTDVVTVCEVVTVGTDPATWDCGADPDPWFPPEPVVEVIEYVIDTFNETFPEQEVCDLLAATGPGVPGVVDVTPEGDVYVNGEFFWDCPPYGA